MKYHKEGPACGRIPYDSTSSKADCEYLFCVKEVLMKKALGLGILGSFFFAFTLILNRSTEFIRRLLDVERSTAVCVHAADSCGDSVEKSSDAGNTRRNPEKAGLLDFMEHGRLRAFLCTAVTCLYVWGIVADCIDLADYDRSGGSFNRVKQVPCFNCAEQ